MKRKQTSESGNKEFLMSLTPLLDDLPQEELARVRQEVVWAIETGSQGGKERRVISAMAASPDLWDSGDCEDSVLWLHLAHDCRLPVDECKKIWTELVTDFKNHLEQSTSREKWKYEDEMSFYLPYITDEDKKCPNIYSKMKIEMNDGEEDEDGKLPVELCQVECPASPSDTLPGDTLMEFFINMGKTVATFPLRLQAQVKSEVFRAVNNAELTLHSGDSTFRLSSSDCG